MYFPRIDAHNKIPPQQVLQRLKEGVERVERVEWEEKEEKSY